MYEMGGDKAGLVSYKTTQEPIGEGQHALTRWYSITGAGREWYEKRRADPPEEPVVAGQET